MQIDRIFYPVRTLGFGSRIGIWVVGCPHACPNCSNPELWEPDATKDIPVTAVWEMLMSIRAPVDGVTITGGEPFEQTENVYHLVRLIRKYLTGDIVVYTGYTIEELRERRDVYTDKTLQLIAVLIDGRYIEDLNDGRLALRGSSNQRIHILNPDYEPVYRELARQKRQSQNVYVNNRLFSIGIPVNDFWLDLDDRLSGYGIEKSAKPDK